MKIMTAILKAISSVFVFTICSALIYLSFAFICWDIEWIVNAHWFVRLLFILAWLPFSIGMSALPFVMFEDYYNNK